MTTSFDDLEIGQVIPLGATVVDDKALAAFCSAFMPEWDTKEGAPEAMVYAMWSRLDSNGGPGGKRLGVDALRWRRNPPVGELLRGRLTIMGKDPVGDNKGLVIGQHDLVDESGRLVFSCLTRSVHAR